VSYALFETACKEGDLATVKKYDCEEFRKAYNFWVFKLAVCNGHLEIVKFLDNMEARKSRDWLALRTAMSFDYTELVNFLMTGMPPLEIKWAINYYGSHS
jgi:hypothetical protein